MRKHTVKQDAAFQDKVVALIKSFGAVEREAGENSSYKYKLQTKAGLLRVSLHEPDKSTVYSVYCKFDDEKQAKAVLPHKHVLADRLNPHSGKWNFHQYDADILLFQLQLELQEIAVTQPE